MLFPFHLDYTEIMILFWVIFFIGIPIAILRRMKVGYALARLVYGGLAVLFSGMINPCNVDDLVVNEYTQEFFVEQLEVIIFIIIFGLLFFCLGEHARLRGIYPPRKENELPWYKQLLETNPEESSGTKKVDITKQ